MAKQKKLVKVDANRIFRHAFAFECTSNFLMGMIGPPVWRVDLMVSHATNCSLAIELYLKTVLCMRGDGYPPVHELDTLFGLLTEDVQAEIGRRINFPSPAFAQYLSVHRDAFETWRYLHESKGPQNFSMGNVPPAIRELILEWQPGWRDNLVPKVPGSLATPPTLHAR